MRVLLAARAIFFVMLLPGAVAGYVPFLLLQWTHRLRASGMTPTAVAAVTIVATGVAVLSWTVWDFFAQGEGTLAPIDPPQHLVVRGLYRFTRNPMYNGVALILFGEALLFRSGVVACYALFVCVLFHLFVVFYEEPTLISRFGGAYLRYRAAVPRWGFTLRPFRTATNLE